MNEKCVVKQHQTTTEQLNRFNQLLNSCNKNRIPIEWIINIADESNGWFYGTAYHFNDSTNMLHVMVPDKLNPSFDGEISLDHHTVHLVECVDGQSDALFNKIIRDSIIKIKWELEWFEEVDGNGNGNEKQLTNNVNSPEGRWISSIARYYIQMTNQLLMEDEDIGEELHGFIIITADLNVKLKLCVKEKGIEDFTRLINEEMVQSIPNAIENSIKSMDVVRNEKRENSNEINLEIMKEMKEMREKVNII